MRFLRALRLITFPDILQYLSILRSHFSIRLTQIALTIFAVWLASAGFIHLVSVWLSIQAKVKVKVDKV
jgi:hypothetical protein